MSADLPETLASHSAWTAANGTLSCFGGERSEAGSTRSSWDDPPVTRGMGQSRGPCTEHSATGYTGAWGPDPRVETAQRILTL